MTEDFTPTDDEIREIVDKQLEQHVNENAWTPFDRWLHAHDTRVRKEAFDRIARMAERFADDLRDETLRAVPSKQGYEEEQ